MCERVRDFLSVSAWRSPVVSAQPAPYSEVTFSFCETEVPSLGKYGGGSQD